MKTNKSLLSNIIASGVFQLLFLLTPIITTPYITRIFSPSQMGLYGVSYSIVILLIQVAQFGLPIYGIRTVAQSQDRTETFFELFSIQLFFCIGIFFLFNLFNLVFIEEKKVYFIQSLLVIASIFDVSWFFMGIEEIKKNIMRNTLSKIISILCVFVFIHNSKQLPLYIAIVVLGNLLGNMSMMFQLHNYINWNKTKLRISKKHLRQSFGLLVPQSVDVAKNTVSRLIITSLSSYSQVGLYDQGLKIIVMLNGVISSMGGAITPRIAYLVSIDKHNEIRKIIIKFMLYIYIGSLILMSGILVTGTPFSTLFFGKQFDKIDDIIRISSISIMFSSISYFLGKCVMVPYLIDKVYRKLSVYSAIFLILLMLIFVPYFGGKGAAIAYVLTSIFLSFLSLWSVKDLIRVKWQIVNLLVTLTLTYVNYSLVTIITKEFYFQDALLNFFMSGILSVVFSSLLSIILIWLNKKVLFKEYY